MKRTTARKLGGLAVLTLAMLGACNVAQEPVPSAQATARAGTLAEASRTTSPRAPEASATNAPTELVSTSGPGATPETATSVAPEATQTPGESPVAVEPDAEVEPTSTLAATATSPTLTPDPTVSIVVDHTSVADFERIPEEYIGAAGALRMIFVDRSVGWNIDDGLTCLSYPNADQAPSRCVQFEHGFPAFSVERDEIGWSRVGGYDRSNWTYETETNCHGGDWRYRLSCFIQIVEPVIGNYNVLSFQFNYLDVIEGSRIAAQPGGYFWDNADMMDVYDQEAFEARYPDKVFIYWTTSLARGIGTSVSDEFNDQMRQYAMENGKPLFDVADILSHDPDGTPCFDNRDGFPYDNGNNAENHADDGHNYHAICPHYTTEVEGGHLGSVSTGKIRVAKAFWVLMARIAGWDGVSR